MQSKRELELELQKLKSFEKPSLKLEQYQTPADIAAGWIWTMAMKREVAGKIFLDAACGSGILGIGLLLLGAKKVYFLDMDEKIIQTCIENYNLVKEQYEIGEAEFIIEDISLFDGEVDIVIQNPPFGTKEEHADKRFLEKAFQISNIIYSMHKYSTKDFVEAICKDFNYQITEVWRFDFPIKSIHEFHKKPLKYIDVGLWRLEKHK